MVSQAIKQRKLGLIESPPAPITYGKPSRWRFPCAHERLGESRRFIDPPSWLEETGIEYQMSMVLALNRDAASQTRVRGVLSGLAITDIATTAPAYRAWPSA
jgi:hypothetical protein